MSDHDPEAALPEDGMESTAALEEPEPVQRRGAFLGCLSSGASGIGCPTTVDDINPALPP